MSILDLEKALKSNINLEECTCVTDGHPMYIATDIGSTTQRTILFSPPGDMQSAPVKMGTSFCSVPSEADYSYCMGASNSIIDNLDLEIHCSNPNENTFVRDMRIVKGSLLNRLNLSERELTSDASKVDSVGMYVNILCNISVLMLAERVTNKESLSEIQEIDVTVALPPDDANIADRVRLFKSRLMGSYSVVFNRLGVTVRFNIDAKNIYTGSEPLGAALYRIMADDDIDTETNCGFLDCGGRSSGTIFFVDGVLKEGSSYAFPIGGVSLLDALADRIAEINHIQRPRLEAMYKVLETGIYKYGGQKLQVADAITEAKKTVAEELFNGLSRGLALNKLQAVDLERVYCSGRTFGVTQSDTGNVLSQSVCTFLKQLFREKSPSTEFIRECDDTAVVKGMVYVRMRYPYNSASGAMSV